MPNTTIAAPPTRMLELPVALLLIRRIGTGNLKASDAAAYATATARDAQVVDERLVIDELAAQLEQETAASLAILAELDGVDQESDL